MKPYFKGVKLAFCIYQLIYGFAAINRSEQVSPVVFKLVVAVLFLDVVIDILEDLMK